MKKVVYMILIAFATSLAVTACTEEEVAPSTVMNGGGGDRPDRP